MEPWSPWELHLDPMSAQDFMKMAFVFWQVLATNILLQVGYYGEHSYYDVYTLWRILSGRRIN